MNCINFLKGLYQALCFRLTPAFVKQHYAAQIETLAQQFSETLNYNQVHYERQIENLKDDVLKTFSAKPYHWNSFCYRYKIRNPTKVPYTPAYAFTAPKN